jgi:hypothetical protein
MRLQGGSRDTIASIVSRYRAGIQRKRAGQAAAVCDADVTSNVHAFLSPAMFCSLRDLAGECQMRSSDGCLESVVERLSEGNFGVDAHTQQYMLMLLSHHRRSTMPKLARLKMLVKLQQRCPHAYNLLQIAAELIKENGVSGSGGRVIGRFSVQTIEAQVAAAGRKLLAMTLHMPMARLAIVRKGMAECEDKTALVAAEKKHTDHMQSIRASFDAECVRQGGLVEKSGVCLHFCSVCQTVYSNVRDSVRSCGTA